MHVLVSGATGLIGTALVRALSQRGDEVTALCRSTSSPSARGLAALAGVKTLPWSATGTREPWWQEIPGVQGIVNLAGEPLIGKRWSPERKALIVQSRVNATRSLARAVEAATTRPRVFVSASAVGYYGFHGDEELDEKAPRGDDFLASVCYEWESAAKELEALGVRLVLSRIGIVLAAADSALQEMALPFRFFAGGPIGSGRQWVSWVHLGDVVGLLLTALDNPAISGPMNITAPNPVRNSELSSIIGKVLGRPNWLPVPTLALRVAVGEMSEMIVTGQRVLPRVAQKTGYTFQFPECREAVRGLLV